MKIEGNGVYFSSSASKPEFEGYTCVYKNDDVEDENKGL